MFSLIYKDFLLQRGTKSFFYLILMPVISALAASQSTLYILLLYLAGSYVYINSANAFDDKYRAERILLSMPVRRRTIVGAKYMGILLYLAGYIVTVALLSGVFGRLLKTGVYVSFSSIIDLITITAVYYSILFPLNFKQGYQKSRWANYISMIVSMGLYAAATKVMSAKTGLDINSIQSALSHAADLGSGGWNVLLLLFSAALLLLSFCLSERVYNAREF